MFSLPRHKYKQWRITLGVVYYSWKQASIKGCLSNADVHLVRSHPLHDRIGSPCHQFSTDRDICSNLLMPVTLPALQVTLLWSYPTGMYSLGSLIFRDAATQYSIWSQSKYTKGLKFSTRLRGKLYRPTRDHIARSYSRGMKWCKNARHGFGAWDSRGQSPNGIRMPKPTCNMLQ